MFFSKPKEKIEWMIVGLGNPGKKYDNTRHNIGFEALDYAANLWNIKITKAKFQGLYGTGEVVGEKVVLVKPQTFMNLSGVCVQQVAAFYKIPPENIVVLADDISLTVGALRIRLSGSAGGHNGFKSIIASVGTDFPRVKIGVGEKPHPDYDLANWVLSRFTTAEKQAIEARYDDITKACELMLQKNATQAMSLYNGAGKPK